MQCTHNQMQGMNNQEMSSYNVSFHLQVDPEENKTFGTDAFEDGHEVGYFLMRDESLLSCGLLISYKS